MYALIKNQLVVSVILADAEFAAHIGPEWDAVVALDTPELQLVGVGWGYAGGVFAAPVQPELPSAPVPVDPALWLIDVGPFFDRFGAAKMPVLTSADAGVKAILSDLQVRHWVDLQRADVAQALAYVGNVVATVTPELQASILTTPVSVSENMVLRKLYF